MSTKEQAVALVLSLVATVALTHLLLDAESLPHAIAGWTASSAVMLACSALVARAMTDKSRSRSPLFALATIFVRLFSLIILLVIVLVGGFLRPEPFITGLLSAYFIGSWIEIRHLLRKYPEPVGGGRPIDEQHGGSGNSGN